MTAKIVFFEIEPWESPYLQKKLKGFACSFLTEKLSQKTIRLARDAAMVSVFVYSVVTKDIISKIPTVKCIATRSTGFDHIDIKECTKRGISVVNVPRYGENTVAEHTFALILNLTRKIHKAWDRTRHLDFSSDGLRGIDLRGKTLGVVGTGSIGRQVIRIAKGFEMNVLAYDAFQNTEAAAQLGFVYVPLKKLLSHSDIITLHVPYMKETHHIINQKTIRMIKNGALLINTARGALIDTDALVRGLDKKIIGGAGLDVLEEEQFSGEDAQVMSHHFPKQKSLRIILENHILAQKENVIITPHNAFNSIEAVERILDTTAQNIIAFNSGKPQNVVGGK